jgi:hypothetical protein
MTNPSFESKVKLVVILKVQQVHVTVIFSYLIYHLGNGTIFSEAVLSVM